MDPVTQGVFGALAGAAASRRRQQRPALLIGAVAGMAPDLDILIRSASDPLVAVEYHRHFTHALLFAPVGAMLVALLAWPLLRRRMTFARCYAIALAGMASHAVLDCFTAYGTLWWWPLSKQRVAWDWMSIIDPLFTLPLLMVVVLAAWRLRRRWVAAGLGFAAGFLLLAGWQHQRVLGVQAALIAERGHTTQQRRVMPSLGNEILWRSVYRQGDTWVVDAIRLTLGTAQIRPGGRIPVYRLPDGLSPLVAADLQRYIDFTQGYVGATPLPAATQAAGEPTGLQAAGDVRYAALPWSLTPLWQWVYDPAQSERNGDFINSAVAERQLGVLWQALVGEHCEPPECFERP